MSAKAGHDDQIELLEIMPMKLTGFMHLTEQGLISNKLSAFQVRAGGASS